MDKKPLSKEDRDKLREFLGEGTDDRCALNQFWSQRVLAAEAYWREAVKKCCMPILPQYGSSECECVFCGGTECHDAECPYKRAQAE